MIALSKKLSNNKTPGLDLIVGYWIKYMTAVHPYLMNLYVRIACKEIDLPAWLIQMGTNMLAKNTNTRNPQKIIARTRAKINVKDLYSTNCIFFG